MSAAATSIDVNLFFIAIPFPVLKIESD